MLKHGTFRLSVRNNFLPFKDSERVEQIAHSGCAASHPWMQSMIQSTGLDVSEGKALSKIICLQGWPCHRQSI